MIRSRALLPVIALAAPVWLMVAAFAQQAAPAPDVIAVQASRPGADIAPTMFGVFFEDINFAADGGLYPERIKNRSFEFDEPLAGWAKRFMSDGELTIRTDRPLNAEQPALPARARARRRATGSSSSNTGFRGIGVQAGAEYVVSAYARPRRAGPQSVRVTLNDERGGVLGQASLGGFTGEWKRYEATITPTATNARAQFQIVIDQAGDVDLDMVSLFPKDTWKNRPNGLRTDLVQLLADLKPGFLRFPGGCIVEGRRLALRYQWKKTIGDVDRTARPDQPLGRRERARSPRTTTSRSAWASSSTSSWPRTSARARCRSSTAGWPASSTRASWRRSTSSTRTSRTRST